MTAIRHRLIENNPEIGISPAISQTVTITPAAPKTPRPADGRVHKQPDGHRRRRRRTAATTVPDDPNPDQPTGMATRSEMTATIARRTTIRAATPDGDGKGDACDPGGCQRAVGRAGGNCSWKTNPGRPMFSDKNDPADEMSTRRSLCGSTLHPRSRASSCNFCTGCRRPMGATRYHEELLTTVGLRLWEHSRRSRL
jgi:hypothetical protein